MQAAVTTTAGDGPAEPAGSGGPAEPTGSGGPAEPVGEHLQQPWALPPGATQLLLVRHGASAAAVAGQSFPLVGGQGDPPLSSVGQAQAIRLAERLRKSTVSALFVTTLVRTAQTAAPLARILGQEPVVVPELREVGLGDWEGGLFRIRLAERHPIALRMIAEERWEVIPGAEDCEDFARRVQVGLRVVADRTGPDATAVAVVHAGVIAEACSQVTGSRPFAFVHAENGSITRLVADAQGGWRLRSFNDTGHLGPDHGRARR
jgi:probable phosphoglycerate mutase